MGVIGWVVGLGIGSFLVLHPKGHRLTGTILGPAVALLSSLLGGKSAAAGGKQKERKPATKETKAAREDGPEESKLQEMLDSLENKKKDLDKLDHAGRAALLRKCLKTIQEASPGLVEETLKFKGSYEPGNGEEVLAWGATVCVCRQLAQTFEALAAGKEPQPVSVDKHESGRTVVTTFPQGFYECGLFPGYNGELWFEKGVELEREKIGDAKARLMFLLGAGNQATVIGCDVLNVIFREHAVCICKLNPVNDYLLPHVEKAFAPLIEAGLLQFVVGSMKTSEFLIKSDKVEALHLTGSDKTYDAIMWGPGAKKEGKPKLDKPFTAELGACTPYIITPGNWDDVAMDLHARQLVSGVVHNAHFNCVSTQLILTDKNWSQRQQFLDTVGKHLKAAQPRTAYYPGAKSRYDKFCAEYKDKIEVVGQKAEDSCVPFTLVTNADRSSHACGNEAFTGIVTEIPLETGGSAKAFLEEATKFCNESVWGTLSCSVWMPPDTPKDVSEKAITDLRYGSVCINVPSILGYFVTKCTWGGYKGHTPQDIQSGIGNIHNVLMYKNVEKSVVRGPWKQIITPFWCHDHANLENLAPWIVAQLGNESLINWTMCAIHAVQG